MATLSELKELALHAARGTAPANYSTEDVNEALRSELREWCKSNIEFQRHVLDIHELIVETADEVVPPRVEAAIGSFAEIRNVPQNQNVVFKRKLGRTRAKSFVTTVGLAGVYEAFRLDSETYSVGMTAIGAAAMVDFERMLDGEEDMAELIDIIAEGMEERVYKEVTKALQAAKEKLAVANMAVVNGYDASKMAKLVSNVKIYGQGAVIFATPQFIDAMGADVIVPTNGLATNPANAIVADDVDAIHRTGRIKIFRGTPIVEIPQSFTDDTNSAYVTDPQYAYILPTGGEKPVKVVFEGATQILNRQNEDWSYEFRTYKKMGLAIHAYNNWGIYQNTDLADESPVIK